jgi:hypothetical protein
MTGLELLSLRERFPSKYNVDPSTGCWMWTGAKTRRRGQEYAAIGYPVTRRETRVFRGHRVAWELYRGAVPPGKHVLHRCDVPSCVNPEHLFLGTHQDNMIDMTRKGRGRYGAKKKAA